MRDTNALEPRGFQTSRGSTGGKSTKGIEDYVKAIKRRFWLVLLVALVLGGGGTAFTFLQTPVYWASSRILIEPPRAIVDGLNEERAGGGADAAVNFFNTRVQMITSRRIAERVLQALQLSEWDELNGVDDPAAELSGWISVKPVKNSNLVDVGIEGNDAKLVAKIVNSTVEEFLRNEQDGLRESGQANRTRVDAELRGLEGLVNEARSKLSEFHKSNEKFLLNGDSLENLQLSMLEEAKIQAELQLDAAKQEVARIKGLREAGFPFFSQISQAKADSLREEMRRYDDELAYQKGIIQDNRYDRDPVIRRLRENRAKVQQEFDSLGAEDAEVEIQQLELQAQSAQMRLDHIEELAANQRKAVIGQQPEQSRLLTLNGEADRLQSLKEYISRKKLELEIREGLNTSRIQVIDRAQTPINPIRPIKWIQIPLVIVGGFFLGGMLVVGLEFLDHSVRVPEQALAALDWPLLGVIPRFARRELVMSNGTLSLASEAPGSPFCESFRNLRIGILGTESDEGLRSLLVTSCGAGEGKSLIAANLAATCARAGESVALIDVDLRTPSQGKFFGLPDSSIGLADVLSGDAPWQEALATTSTPNLSVMPAGQADGVPLDILGTVEMHDLLETLVDEFDRVIIDGPALLGLADSRVVGRFADGILFVVQAGALDNRPLERVKQLCDHEGLRPAGLVFNGMRGRHEDLANVRTASTSRTSRRTMATEGAAA